MEKSELAQYVKNLQLGDISAFEIIYNETNTQVYNLLYSYTKSEYTSFDLMQETYLIVNDKIGSLKDPCAIKSWINRIAINKANRFFEKHKREVLLSEDGQDLFENQLELDEEFLPQEILESKEKQGIIKDIIDNLPIEQKTAVYLYYFDEQSLTEIAEDMKCSEGTVKSRLNYARKKIKKEVDTWEKKGTKLYGAGAPILLLLIEKQLGTESIPLDKASDLFKNIVNTIGEASFAHQVGSVSLSNKISATAKTTKKILGIKSAIAGVSIVVMVTGAVYINKKPEPIDNIYHEYITYSELEMDDGISSMNVSGDNIAIVNDLKEDKCIDLIFKEDNLEQDTTESKKEYINLVNLNGKEVVVDIVKENDDLRIHNSLDISSHSQFISYRYFTKGNIEKITSYDENIIKITNNSNKKQIEIEALDAGNTTAEIIDDKGLKGELQLELVKHKDIEKPILNSTYIECK